MARSGIALGSNVGDRAANLRAALVGLRAISAAPPLAAPIYETSPVGCPDGAPTFLNTVVEIDWPGTPAALLAETRALESRIGRIPSPVRNAPRVIDIDILYCGDAAINLPDLVLPHPRMAVRRFVLMPLADIRPGLRPHPGGPDVSTLLATLDTGEPEPQRVRHPAWPPDPPPPPPRRPNDKKPVDSM